MFFNVKHVWTYLQCESSVIYSWYNNDNTFNNKIIIIQTTKIIRCEHSHGLVACVETELRWSAQQHKVM